MILRQFLHTGPVGISYLFGCGGKATGAVRDVPRSPIDAARIRAVNAGLAVGE